MVKYFFAPEYINEAINLKKNDRNAFFLAGGTLLNRGSRENEITIISLHKLQELKKILIEEKDIVIGSMVTLMELYELSILKENGLKELQEACQAISRNIRNMATIGGCIAYNNFNSDIIPTLVVANAHIVCNEDGKKGVVIPIEDYIAKRSQGYSHLIMEVKIPIPGKNVKIIGKRFARTSLDFPTVKVAAAIEYDGDMIKSIVLAAGGVDKSVIRLKKIEEFLSGKNLRNAREKLNRTVAEIIESMVKPQDDLKGTTRFKKSVLEALLEDIFQECSRERR